MSESKSITRNRKAYYEYEIIDKVEAGLVLKGTEVKSIRAGKINLQDGWVEITEEGEAILRQVHISPYSYGNIFNHEPQRPRQLLLKKDQIIRIQQKIEQKGMTLVPLAVYIKGQWVKISLGLGKGKKLHDKRQHLKEKTSQQDMERALKKYK